MMDDIEKQELTTVTPMLGEHVELYLSPETGLQHKEDNKDTSFILTNKRLIRLSHPKTNPDLSYLSIKDIQVAELAHSSTSKTPLLRICLLFAGAYSSFATITLVPLSLAVVAILGGAGLYQSIRFFLESGRFSVTFKTENHHVSMEFRNKMIADVYLFVNDVFRIKESMNDVDSD